MKLTKRGCIDIATIFAGWLYITFISTVLTLLWALITKDLTPCKYTFLTECGIFIFGLLVWLHFCWYNEHIKEIKNEKIRKFFQLD